MTEREFLYKRVKTGGRSKYEPVREYDYDELDKTWPLGTHVVVVSNFATIYKYSIREDYAPLIAAATALSDDIVKIMIEKSEPTESTRTPWNVEQIAAWGALAATFGKSANELSVNFPNKHEVATAVLDVIMEKAIEMHKNEATKQAFDHYLTIAALSK